MTFKVTSHDIEAHGLKFEVDASDFPGEFDGEHAAGSLEQELACMPVEEVRRLHGDLIAAHQSDARVPRAEALCAEVIAGMHLPDPPRETESPSLDIGAVPI